MGFFQAAVLLVVAMTTTPTWAWESHTLASYRAFERMPELVNAPDVSVEPLESFIQWEENTLEALLASQEAWARSNLDKFPGRPAALAFTADPSRSPEARRTAFLMALRMAPDSKFALYYQPDPWSPASGTRLAPQAVSTQPDRSLANATFLALKPGDSVSALAVLASATEEPDYGLDANLWEDSPSEWGRLYAFGPQPQYGGRLAEPSQSPFHSAFMHESRVQMLLVPFLKNSYLRWRFYQFSTLASLAFRTGHAYWGWRFAGMALHYVQDLTQPYQAAWSPDHSGARLWAARAMAAVGMPGLRDDLNTLRLNRQAVLNKYHSELMARNAASRQPGPLEKALHAMDKDKNYPEWSDHYLRGVVSSQSARLASDFSRTLVAAMPHRYVQDADFEFRSNDPGTHLLTELAARNPSDLARLEGGVAELMANLGSHSRNALQEILRASASP